MTIVESGSITTKTLQFSANPVINQKVEQALKGLYQPGIRRYFLDFTTGRDKELVADFILTCVHQENITVNIKGLGYYRVSERKKRKRRKK